MEDRTWPDRDPEELRKRGDLLGELWREFEALKEDPESLDGILQELQGEYGGRALKKEQKALSEEEKEEVLERALWKLMDEFLQNEEEKE